MSLEEDTTKPMEESLSAFQEVRASLTSFARPFFQDPSLVLESIYYSPTRDLPVLRFRTDLSVKNQENQIQKASQEMGQKLRKTLGLTTEFAIEVSPREK